MTKPDDSLGRLDRDLDAFEAGRRRATSTGVGSEAGEGYRLVGQLLGGVFGGIGLGWLFDHFAHTTPWGLVGGLVGGATVSIYATVRAASRISARAEAKLNPVAPAPKDDDDDD